MTNKNLIQRIGKTVAMGTLAASSLYLGACAEGPGASPKPSIEPTEPKPVEQPVEQKELSAKILSPTEGNVYPDTIRLAGYEVSGGVKPYSCRIYTDGGLTKEPETTVDEECSGSHFYDSGAGKNVLEVSVKDAEGNVVTDTVKYIVGSENPWEICTDPTLRATNGAFCDEHYPVKSPGGND